MFIQKRIINEEEISVREQLLDSDMKIERIINESGKSYVYTTNQIPYPLEVKKNPILLSTIYSNIQNPNKIEIFISVKDDSGEGHLSPALDRIYLKNIEKVLKILQVLFFNCYSTNRA